MTFNIRTPRITEIYILQKTLDSSGGGSILKKIHKKIILIRELIY